MRRIATLALLSTVATAHADEEPLTLTVTAPRRWEHHGPVLDLAAGMRPNTKGIAVTEDERVRIIDLGPARALARGSWWTSEQTTLGPSAHLDVVARGWDATLALSYDVGPFTIGANATLGHVDSAYARGTYRDVGLTISKTARLSRWMTGWISLGLGSRHWYGEKPPAGEANGTTLMLSIGTTFR